MLRLEKLEVMLYNVTHWHQRAMAGYLRKRGWVVMYLPGGRSRVCIAGYCWLRLYDTTFDEGAT